MVTNIDDLRRRHQSELAQIESSIYRQTERRKELLAILVTLDSVVVRAPPAPPAPPSDVP